MALAIRRRISLTILLLLASSLVFLPCNLVSGAGGADSSKSSVFRTLGGIADAAKFLSQTMESRGNKNRQPTNVKLCVVGLGRTGSTSIYTALQHLGYTPLHDPERLENSDLMAGLFDNEISVDTFSRKLGERGFDSVLYYGYDFIDWCVQNERKIILTVRDNARKWAESWKRTVPFVDYLDRRPYMWTNKVREIMPGMRYICKDVPTGGRPEQYKDVDVLMEGYKLHNDKVRQMVPENLLLEFNAKQGWKPLCEFLGKDVPQIDFPHVNDKVVMRAVLGTLLVVSWIWPLFPLLIIMILVTIIKEIRGICDRRMQVSGKAKKY